MARLTAEEMRGIWAGVTLSWDEKYRFEEDTYAKNIKGLIAAGVHGIYTTGSTGEFYALEYEEYCRMVDIVSEVCGGAGMPLQIGCCSDATAKTVRLLEYAAGKKAVGAAQVGTNRHPPAPHSEPALIRQQTADHRPQIEPRAAVVRQ